MAKRDATQKAKEAAPAEEIRWTSIESMRPTQCAVGYLEVGLKMRELRARSAKLGALEKYIKNNPIPAVMGPDSRMYLTDRHHMGLALTRLALDWDDGDQGAGMNPYRKCCFKIVEDYSARPEMPLKAFFVELEAQGLCHPYDGEGRRSGPPPRSLLDLEDDPYRSLAGLARKAGAYEKVATPYVEFAWANFFRKIIPRSLIARTTLAEAIERASILAASPAACALPGFKGPKAKIPSLADIQARLAKRHGTGDEADADSLAPAPKALSA